MAWQPDYCAVSELQTFMRIGDNQDDDVLGWAISASSRAIDAFCDRQFGNVETVQERFYTPVWDRKLFKWCVEVDDIYTLTGLVIADVENAALTIDTSKVRGLPRNALLNGEPYTQLVILEWGAVNVRDDLAVTASYGWASVPIAIKNACLVQASRLVTRRDAPFGIAGSSEMGSEIRLLSKIDADVQVMLGGYKRWWGAV